MYVTGSVGRNMGWSLTFVGWFAGPFDMLRPGRLGAHGVVGGSAFLWIPAFAGMTDGALDSGLCRGDWTDSVRLARERPFDRLRVHGVVRRCIPAYCILRQVCAESAEASRMGRMVVSGRGDWRLLIFFVRNYILGSREPYRDMWRSSRGEPGLGFGGEGKG